MTYADLIPIVVEAGADGIDLTSYWLPTENLDPYLVSLRRLAWKNRVEIYSVGTRIPSRKKPVLPGFAPRIA